MDIIIGFIILLFSNLITIALPSLVAAWFFTLVLPVSFSQMVWLSLSMFLVVRYVILVLTDIPGAKEMDFVTGLASLVISVVLLALSGLCGWLLLHFIALDLTLFETILLFAVSLTAGFFFTARSGTGGLPLWMTDHIADLDDEIEKEVVIPRSKRPRKQGSPRQAKS
jgi:hypothetical protein